MHQQPVGNSFITQAMAALLPKLSDVPEIGVFNCLEALPMVDWSPPLATLESILESTAKSPSAATADSVDSSNLLDQEGENKFSSNSLKIRDLRSLQELVKVREMQRRQGLAGLLIDGDGIAFTPKSLNGDIVMSDIVRRTTETRAKRAEALMLAEEASRVAHTFREIAVERNGTGQHIRMTSSLQTRQNRYREAEAEEFALAELFLGASSSLMVGVAQVPKPTRSLTDTKYEEPRMLQFGSLLAEARLLPDHPSRILEIKPHYDAAQITIGEGQWFSPDEGTSSASSIEDDDSILNGGDAASSAKATAALSAVVARARVLLPGRSLGQGVQVARSMGLLRYVDRDLMAALLHKMQSSMPFQLPGSKGGGKAPPPTPATVSDFIWCFATLGLHDMLPRGLVRELLDTALATPGGGYWSAMAMSRLAWSLAVLDELDAPTFIVLCDKIFSSNDVVARQAHEAARKEAVAAAWGSPDEEPGSLNLRERDRDRERDGALRVVFNQLYQSALHLEIKTGQDHLTLLPRGMQHAAAAAWDYRRSFLSTSSLQRQVASVLRSMGYHCVLEHCPPGSPVVIDIAVTDPGTGRQVAVEVDGPYHYALNDPCHPLGAVRLRDALLRHTGWSMVSVPWYEFGALRWGGAMRSYLQRAVVSRLIDGEPPKT